MCNLLRLIKPIAQRSDSLKEDRSGFRISAVIIVVSKRNAHALSRETGIFQQKNACLLPGIPILPLLETKNLFIASIQRRPRRYRAQAIQNKRLALGSKVNMY